MIETSSAFPGKYSAILDYLRTFSEIVRQRGSCDLRSSLGESWKIFVKWPEMFGKWSKMSASVCLDNNITL